MSAVAENSNCQLKKSRKFCFTLNNWNNSELEQIISSFNTLDSKYIIGKEKGEQGTPHLQGYVEFKNPRSFNTLKKINNRLHIEKTIGTRIQNIKYCNKENNYISNFTDREESGLSFREYLKNKTLKDMKFEAKEWQQEIIDKIDKEESDNRKIYWYWDRNGNTGKSYICKYLVSKYNAIIADGKKDNVFNQVNISIENEIIPKIILLDIPRHNIEYINYGVLEQLKNGLIYSGKYEGGVCVFPSPWVFVFANIPPDEHKYSNDRLVIKYIESQSGVSQAEVSRAGHSSC